MRHNQLFRMVILLGLTLSVVGGVYPKTASAAPPILWVNHFDLLPGDPSVVSTSANSTTSDVGGGLTGLVITSTTTGEIDSFDGNKVVHMALDLPRSTKIGGGRVCYELTSSSSFISQIRLAQVQDPPSSALVLLDDSTDLVDPGPTCVDSEPTLIRSRDGSVLLSLRVNFGDVDDRIVIRALGLK
jgi:hypothetical protein